MVRAMLARQAHFLGRTKVNIVLKPTELLADGSFLARIYPTPKWTVPEIPGPVKQLGQDRQSAR